MTDKQTKHYREINQSRKRLLPTLAANAADSAKDKNGSSTNVYAAALRFIGISDFLLDGDTGSFRSMLSKAAKLRVQLFVRFDRGEPISASYVSTLAYKELFDALAAGDLETATELAQHIGGRPDIEKEHAHPFDNALGYALKAAVLGRDQIPANEMLAAVLQENDNANFRGYGAVLSQLASAQDKVSPDAFRSIVAGHKREAKDGVFKGVVDEIICVWGIGLANLVKARGRSVDFSDDLIPAGLIA